MVQLLLDNGASAAHRNNKQQTAIFLAVGKDCAPVLEKLLEGGARDASANDKDVHGQTALFSATDLECVRLLIKRGCEVDARDRQSRTALFTASDYSIASCLLASKAEIDPRDNELRTPFFNAAARGDRALLHALVEAGCESNARDASGQTALFGAAASAPLDVVRLLISLAGVDPAVKDDKGQLVERAAKKMKPQPQAGVLEYL